MIEGEIFENNPINVTEIPNHDVLVYDPLEPKYLTVNILVTLIVWTIILIVVFALSFQIEWLGLYKYYVMTGVSCLFSILIILEILGFRHKGYALRQRDINYKSGLIFRDITALPFNRVQHCEINEGPLERMFGLSSIKIFTAGGSSSDLEIPGLSKSKAEIIKGFIVKKTASDEEE